MQACTLGDIFLSFLRWIFLTFCVTLDFSFSGALMICTVSGGQWGIFVYPFLRWIFLNFWIFLTFWIFSYFLDFSFSGALMICTLGGGQWGIWDNAADNLGPHCWLTGTLSETTNRHPQSRKYTILKELKGRVR